MPCARRVAGTRLLRARALLATGAAPAKAPPPKPPISLATPKSFAAAVAAIEKATGEGDGAGAQGNPMPAEEGRSFRVEGHVATRLIEGAMARS